ncbi:MAG TPA: glycosyltransferase family 1 protein, partial [Candidatus Thermoplasmatota archaeon]|nr:glycosyltransferase family 1 protein [Candidatus Thermoplasmatota archaeon]
MRVTLVSGRNVAATGVDRYADAISRALRGLGVEVEERVHRRREWRVLGKPVGGFASLWAQRALARRGDAPVLHALDPAVAGRGSDVVTVQDLLPEEFPGWFLRSAGDRLNWRLARRYVSRAPRVIAASRATADALVARWEIPRERIRVVHHGIDAATFHPQDGGHPLLSRDGPTIVYVGDDNPRKNVGLVVRALAALRARDGLEPRLVRCGPARFPEVREAYHADAKAGGVKVVEAGYLPDADLRALLSGAAAFAWPTLGEGFGFPPLEAMACGTPVIALDTPVNREVCGPLARYHADEPQ